MPSPVVHTLLSVFPTEWPMIDALFNSDTYVAAKKLMDVSELKQQTIMSNLANIETPGYQRRHVSQDFESSFQQALASKDPAALNKLKAKVVVDPTASPVRRDGNSVSLENELLALSRLQLEHQFLADRVGGALSKMRMAITGKA